MYPQYSPKKSSTYQVTPQFNPTVQLSPRRVIPTVEDPLPVTFSPRTTVSPPRRVIPTVEEPLPVAFSPRPTVSPPRRVVRTVEEPLPVTFSPRPTVSPPRVVEYDEPVVTVSPERILRMPERVRTLPQPVRDITRFDQQGTVSLDDLPRDVLIEMLINLPPGKLNSLCGTTPALSRLCNDESFLKNLIVRKYGVSINMIPGQTIKEKYAFISQFDPRYFTDPNFVDIPRWYTRSFGSNYTSRKNPNDALNTVSSILNDVQTVDDINNMTDSATITRYAGELVSLRTVTLLSGAVMTKSQLFMANILNIFGSRILPNNLPDYMDSLRVPYILSIEYGLEDIQSLIEQYYDRRSDLRFHLDIVVNAEMTDSDDVFFRLMKYISVHQQLFWNLVRLKKINRADYVLERLIATGRANPFSAQTSAARLRDAIRSNDVETVKYLMKYMVPAQREIDLAIRSGFNNIAAILQEQDVEDEIKDEMDVVNE